MYKSKTKKPLDSIRRQKCGADFKASLFLALRKVEDSLLALRALNPMITPLLRQIYCFVVHFKIPSTCIPKLSRASNKQKKFIVISNLFVLFR